MPTPREIVKADPKLQKLRQFGFLLTILVAVTVLGAIVLWNRPAGRILAVCAVLLVVVAVRQLLLLGRQIEAIQRGPQPPKLIPKSPAFFGGFMGVLGLIFVVIAGAAAVGTLLELAGLIHPGALWWMLPFFALLCGFVGLLNAGIGYAMRKSKARADMLRTSGLRGAARMLSVRETGTTVNDNPQVECDLNVSLPGRAEYTATVRTVVPLIKIGLLTSPAPVKVFVNPTDHNDIFVDW
jgi:hypothetical protein